MNDIRIVAAMVVGLSSLVSFATAWLLGWRWKGARHSTIVLISGFLPTALIVAALVVLHILWRARHEGGYSPLLILLYGFWLVALNLFCNLMVALFPARARAR